MTQTVTHRDHFGKPLEVGDIALTAKPGGRYFDTQYAFVVVVAKTPKLLRVHQVSISSPEISVEDLKESLERRYGRKGGRVDPRALISTGHKVKATAAEMETWITKGRTVAQGINDSLSSPVTISFF